jgi:predicted RNA polymerase sigma factor
MADGSGGRPALVHRLTGRLDDDCLPPSVRGDLLAKLGRPAAARAGFE